MRLAQRRSYESQCAWKATFTTKKQARRAARQAETILGGGRLTEYRCPWCKRWHNGHDRPLQDPYLQDMHRRINTDTEGT